MRSVKCCVSVRGSDHGGSAHRQHHADPYKVSDVSKWRPESLRPRSVSGSQKTEEPLECRCNTRPTCQVHPQDEEIV